MTPDQYLSNCFAPKQSTYKKQIEQNAIRATITDCLPVFDCSVLSRPCEAEDLLRLDSMPDAELKTLFKEQLQQLTSKVLANPRPKQIEGRTMTGTLFADFVCSVAQFEIPNIQSTITALRNQECLDATKEAVDHFRKKIKKIALPQTKESKLATLIDNAKTGAFKIFEDR